LGAVRSPDFGRLFEKASGRAQPATCMLSATTVDGIYAFWLRDVKQTGGPPAALQQLGTKQYAADSQKDWEAEAD
jgi:hypothetical protein